MNKTLLIDIIEDVSDLRVFFCGNSPLDRSVIAHELDLIETNLSKILNDEGE